jgi:hypothetical protein
MSTFVSLLPATNVVSPRALAAVLLDRAGVDPDVVRAGVTMIDCRVGGIANDIADAIDDLVFAAKGGRHTFLGDATDALIFTRCTEDETLRDSLSRGLPLVLVGAPKDFAPETSVHLDRTYVVDVTLLDDVVRQVVKIVTGDDVIVDGLAAKIRVDYLTASARPGVTGETVIERLTKIVAGAEARRAESERKATEDLADMETRLQDNKLASPEKPAKPEVKLSDLSGYGVAKDWGLQLASEMRAYVAGEIAWEDMDRGILLYGAPGTGKTYLARALANECGVPLVLSSYADWEAAQGGSSYVVKAMRKIFDEARKKAPCIVFIDEIDSLGVRGGSGHNTGYWDAIINALLAELDGANPREGIVVIAATNNPNNVDPALLRAGRLERRVEIPMPDAAAILGILRHHGIPEDGDVADAARACRGKSPATIAMLCRDARRIARTIKRPVCAIDVVDAVTLTRPERDVAFDRIVCIHEAGHAVADVVLETGLQWVDADACATACHTVAFMTRESVRASMISLLAARRADAMLGAGASSGAVGDLAKATAMARAAVAQWGFGGAIRYHTDDEATRSRAIRGQVDEMLDDADIAAAKLVDKQRDAILAVAEALRERRYLDGEEVRQVMATVGATVACHA